MSSIFNLVLTGTQVRAARALLRWSAEELAKRSQLGIATIKRAEAQDDLVPSTSANVQAMRNALKRAGIEFIFEDSGGDGVLLERKREIVIDKE